MHLDEDLHEIDLDEDADEDQDKHEQQIAQLVRTPTTPDSWIQHGFFCKIQHFTEDVTNTLSTNKKWLRCCSHELEHHPNVLIEFDKLRHLFGSIIGNKDSITLVLNPFHILCLNCNIKL